MIIRSRSYARAGLVGNPSDGYFGKTISFIIKDFHAEVTLYETPELKIMPSQRDHSVFDNIHQLSQDVSQFGYYGGIRLLKATVKRFYDYCQENSIELDERNFTIRYQSDVPPQVGMAGSSAIITAGFRALMSFYGVTILPHMLANLVLSVETEELGIPAGLQDRVIQAYEGMVYMDFNREQMETHGFGSYESLDPALLPNVYIAYTTKLSEGTEVFHNDIRGRFDRGDTEVVEAMAFWAELAEKTRALLLKNEGEKIGALLDQNFDKRREIYRMSEGTVRMIETARRSGASAKFTGSGGAIVGVYDDEPMYQRLKEKLEPLGMAILKPTI